MIEASQVIEEDILVLREKEKKQLEICETHLKKIESLQDCFNSKTQQCLNIQTKLNEEKAQSTYLSKKLKVF